MPFDEFEWLTAEDHPEGLGPFVFPASRVGIPRIDRTLKLMLPRAASTNRLTQTLNSFIETEGTRLLACF